MAPTKLVVSKKYTDEEMLKKYQNSYIKPSQIDTIIRCDTDVYTDTGELLLRFRKKKLSKKNTDAYYDATAEFTVMHPTTNRGNTSGCEEKNIATNDKKCSSIIGYFDRWGPKQKYSFKNMNINLSSLPEVRETFFNAAYPDEYKKTIPLITEIDKLYKCLIPKNYAKQYKKAKQTKFRIGKTSFTTVTTNINFRTTTHRDKGDDEEGFGNLAVIGRGEYTGGETCFPQYRIGVDVREGDILFMNVHEWHGNLPVKKKNEDVIRMSIVCYLRKKIWDRSKGMTSSEFKKHIEIQRSINKANYKKCMDNKTRKKVKKKKSKLNTRKCK